MIKEESKAKLEPGKVTVKPEEAAKEYIELASILVNQARVRARRKDLRGASKRLWGAAILAIEAHSSFKKGRWLSTQKELWKYKSEIAEELGEWVHDAWNAAVAMYVSFYEGCADLKTATAAIGRIEALVKGVRKVLEGCKTH